MNWPPKGPQIAKTFFIVSESLLAINFLKVGTSIHVAADKNPDVNPEAATAVIGNIVFKEESGIVLPMSDS